jgi:hypothetical protein
MAVKTFEVIQDRLGWTDYKMAKELGISQTQYIYLRHKAKSTQSRILIRLADIAEKYAGIDGAQFIRLFKKHEG